MHTKLTNEIFDAGEHFQLLIDEESGDASLYLKDTAPPMLHTNSNTIFLVDHTW